MKKTIQTFLDSDKVAIAGASPKKDNFGRTLMVELQKLGKDVLRRGNAQVPSLAQENIRQNSR